VTAEAMDAAEKPSVSDAGVRSVTRVIDLLELFDTAHPTRTLKELVEGTSLPKTTVVRLVATMCTRSVLSTRPDGSYCLGPEMLRWVRLAGKTWAPPQDVVDIMRQLSVDTGETVNLYIRQGLTRIVVAQCESTATVRSVIPLGVPYPLWAGAAGKILLLSAPDLIDDVAADSPHQRLPLLKRHGPRFALAEADSHAVIRQGHLRQQADAGKRQRPLYAGAIRRHDLGL